MLAEAASAAISQKVSPTDNDFKQQVEGRLEVLGLHLHYLKKAVGDYLESYDFVDASKITDPKDEDYKNAKEIYDFLVEKNILHGDRVRKYFRKEGNKPKLHTLIKNNIDKSIADEVLKLLATDHFDKEKLKGIVCSEGELWEALIPFGKAESVWILNGKDLESNIEVGYLEQWNNIKSEINLSNLESTEVGKKLIHDSAFSKFRQYLSDKKFLVETQRVRFDEIDYSRINNNEKYRKYRDISVGDNKHQNIAYFFNELKDFKSKNLDETQGRDYLYKSDIPLGDAEAEADKILMLLKEKRILKSGGLHSAYKYGDTKGELRESVEKFLKDTKYEIHKDFITQIQNSIQGDIRSFEGAFKATLTDFMDLENQEKFPSELFYFSGLCLDKFLTLEDDRSWWNWEAFVVAMIGLSQVIAGAVLCAVGVINIGNALICEGINDMMYAVMAGISGRFSWNEWAMQKAISIALSIITAGISALASIGKVATQVGGLSRMAMFSKILAKAAVNFGVQLLVDVASDKILSTVINSLIEKIVGLIENNILSEVKNSIDKQLRQLYATSSTDEEFEKSFQKLKNSIQIGLGANKTLPNELNQVRTRIMSSVAGSLKVAGSGKIAKGMKAAQIANQLWSLVEGTIQVATTAQLFSYIINNIASEEVNTRTPSQRVCNEETIQLQVTFLNNLIKEHISNKLTKELIKALKGALTKGLTAVAEAGSKKVSDKIEKIRARQQAKKAHESSKNKIGVETPHISNKSSKKVRQAEQKRKKLQENVKNPKDIINDKGRALARADLKMLADRKRRTIEILKFDQDGKCIGKEVIRPRGLRKLVSTFKPRSKINHVEGLNGKPGHFTARRGEHYIQSGRRNDCLLIAYEESRGRAVTKERVIAQRNKLQYYEAKNQNTFFRSVANEPLKRKDPLFGGVGGGQQGRKQEKQSKTSENQIKSSGKILRNKPNHQNRTSGFSNSIPFNPKKPKTKNNQQHSKGKEKNVAAIMKNKPFFDKEKTHLEKIESAKHKIFQMDRAGITPPAKPVGGATIYPSEEAAQAAAKQYVQSLPTANKPAVYATIQDANGKSFFTVSAKQAQQLDLVQKMPVSQLRSLNDVPYNKRGSGHGFCAEQAAIPNAFYLQGKDKFSSLKGAKITAYKSNEHTPIPACGTCEQTNERFGFVDTVSKQEQGIRSKTNTTTEQSKQENPRNDTQKSTKEKKNKGILDLVALRTTQMDYWLDYSEEALTKLLDLRLQSSHISVGNTIMMPSIIDPHAENTNFTQQLNGILTEINKLYSDPCNDVQNLLLPLLIPQSEQIYHWVGIIFEKQESFIKLSYLDSENQRIPEALKDGLKKGLQATYPDYQLQFNQLAMEQQKYNNCGPELIENFVQYLTGSRVKQEEAVYLHNFLSLQDLLLRECSSEVDSHSDLNKDFHKTGSYEDSEVDESCMLACLNRTSVEPQLAQEVAIKSEAKENIFISKKEAKATIFANNPHSFFWSSDRAKEVLNSTTFNDSDAAELDSKR